MATHGCPKAVPRLSLARDLRLNLGLRYGLHGLFPWLKNQGGPLPHHVHSETAALDDPHPETWIFADGLDRFYLRGKGNER